MPFKLKLFFVAMLYGVSLMAALSNSVLLALRLAGGQLPGSVLPTALLGWGIILYLHRQMGWPPFRARGRKSSRINSRERTGTGE